MSEREEVERLSKSAKVVIFHSPLTDLGGLDHELNRRGERWHAVELAMGDKRNRERYEALKHYSGQTTLPQVFVDGRFVGGIRAAREALKNDEAIKSAPSHSPLSPAALGCAALAMLPFVGLAAWVWAHPEALFPARMLAIYGGIGLAIVGSIHFGWALGEHAEARRYWWSILPPFLGWILAALPVGIGLPLLAAAHVGVWYSERQWFSEAFPHWYARLRIPLAWLAAACLLAAWIARLIY